ncbi:MAG: N-acetylglucosamine-6-phosphate deacetylase [Hyphomicrobiales bacterium]
MTGNNTKAKAFVGATIFDGHKRHEDSALLTDDGSVSKIVSIKDIPSGTETVSLSGGLLAPGFVDLQVNGGGGVLLNDQPDVAGIETICAAHAQFGTTSLLPTLITDNVDVTHKAVAAGTKAARQAITGFIGLHLEGPHLSVVRKGAHDADLIRPMSIEDLNFLTKSRASLPHLMTTVAPESVSNEQISELTNAGVMISLGHTAADYETAVNAASSGARAVTHLFNAMSPLTHREPGLVGAALETGHVSVGVIADGIHVHPAAISIALAAKKGPGKIFLVTDAMSTIGTDQNSFTLNGRTITREGGKLILEDGTLAGADLDMITAVRFMANSVGIGVDEALRMAALYPALCIGDDTIGHLQTGAAANMVHLDDDLAIQSVWSLARQIH